MVPLAPVMEYLGAQVSYGRQDHSVSISMDGSTLYHQIGTAQLTVSGGGEGASSEAITMDRPLLHQGRPHHGARGLLRPGPGL